MPSLVTILNTYIKNVKEVGNMLETLLSKNFTKIDLKLKCPIINKNLYFNNLQLLTKVIMYHYKQAEMTQLKDNKLINITVTSYTNKYFKSNKNSNLNLNNNYQKESKCSNKSNSSIIGESSKNSKRS